jgi:RNA-directed DNA polymerase
VEERGVPGSREAVSTGGSRHHGPLEGKTMGNQGPRRVSTQQQRIAELARENPQRVFTSIGHVIDVEFLRAAYRRTRKDGAVGVDGQTAAAYEVKLEENLRSLHERFKSGLYRAPAVRRVHIPKGDGKKTRPIGIPTFEDKVLQRAVAMVLESIYEQDFLDCSYGFRPGRSAHDALIALREGLMSMKGGWILDVDIQGYFDHLDHGKLREILDQRVRDGVLRRAIHKWLQAGVLEQGALSYPESGTPQGGVISPLLANIYLHTVLDKWFEEEVRPRLKGVAFLIRYADDFVLAFSTEEDARRVYEVLLQRFARYGLTLHPEKTRLVRFRRPLYRSEGKGEDWTGQRPETFDFLGFTHYWGRSRKGNWAIKRKTARDRFRRSLRQVADWCRHHRHWRVAEQHRALCQKLEGYDEYYGITGNSDAVSDFHWWVTRFWRKWLDRRSQRGRMTWRRFRLLLQRYPLPEARCDRQV